jgi:MFS family permease
MLPLSQHLRAAAFGRTAAGEIMPEAVRPAGALSPAFRVYLACGALWFAAGGLQQVLFPYMIAVRLEQPAAMVGFAQMIGALPSLLLLIPAGAWADRGDPRAILFAATLCAALPAAALAGFTAAGDLTLTAAILYAVLGGAAGAFVMTSRDAMLSNVADASRLQTAIALFSVATIGAQILGMAGARTASTLGLETLLAVQAALTLAAGFLAAQLPKPAPKARAAETPLSAMAQGIAYAARNAEIGPIIVVMIGVGMFYVGSFLVLVPLLVRDFYQGGVETLSTLSVTFWGASLLINLGLARFSVRRRGLMLLIAVSTGAATLAAFSLGLPYWAFLMLYACWGAGAGVTLNMGRTIVQERVAPEMRGRVLSLYQMGFMGGAPLGALILGLVAQQTGAQAAMLFPAICMALTLVCVALFTPLSRTMAKG